MPDITLKDVAARAGVSYQTVSKVINSQVSVSPDTTEIPLQKKVSCWNRNRSSAIPAINTELFKERQ
jgi:hypothetical protein